MVHLFFTCIYSTSLFCLPYPFSIEAIDIKNFLNYNSDLKDRKSLPPNHYVAMVFTVYYLDPRIEQDVDKEETNKAVTRGIHQ